MIRLQSLSISNFRGIREGGIDDLADVNIVVGRNNSGKTTVIEAITRAATTGGLRQDLFGRDVDQFWQHARSAVPDTEGSNPSQVSNAHSLLFYRQDESKEIEIVGTLHDNESPEKSEEIAYRKRAREMPDSADHRRQPAGAGFHPQAKQDFCSRINVFRPADAFNAAIEQKFWPVLLSDRRDRLLTKTLNDVFGLDAESFQLLPNSQFVVLFNEYSLPLDVQGDGTRSAMRTLMTLAMLKGTLFMIEEPECHQHPGSLERFAGAVCRLAKAQSVQTLISTHSAECVRSFMQAAQAAEATAAVFHLTLDDGKQDARRLDSQAVESLADTGIDVRFLDLYA
jgi:AAA15 family ATPase/GTPase